MVGTVGTVGMLGMVGMVSMVGMLGMVDIRCGCMGKQTQDGSLFLRL